MAYIVKYSNQGRREKSPAYLTIEEVKKCAAFLRFQGAKRLKLYEHYANMDIPIKGKI